MISPSNTHDADILLAYHFEDLLNQLPVPAEYRPPVFWGVLTILVLAALRALLRGLSRRVRRRLVAPTINPKLAKYNVDHAQLDRARRKLAEQILATTTGGRLAGYRIVRQVEAVFVDGLRTPEDALIALKAQAAECGANALLNVRTERTTAGRCSASGDAVVVAPPDNQADHHAPWPASSPPGKPN